MRNIAEKMADYRAAVCTLSYYLALISLIGERVENGELTDKAALDDALHWASLYKEKFFSARRELGLCADEKAMVAFEEDFLFNGFGIVGGKFSGDMAIVDQIASKWDVGEKVPTEDAAVRYEVSVFCTMLSGGSQMVFSTLKEDENPNWEQELLGEEEYIEVEDVCSEKVEKKTGFLTKVRSFFSGKNDAKRRKLWESAWEEEDVA